jgi:hypothetical protein
MNTLQILALCLASCSLGGAVINLMWVSATRRERRRRRERERRR